jgi:hypothetical protein
MLETAIIKYNFGLAKRSAPCIPLKDIFEEETPSDGGSGRICK